MAPRFKSYGLRLNQLDVAHSHISSVPPPMLTCGKNTKPLPLKGDHFFRPDIFDTPPDEEDDDSSCKLVISEHKAPQGPDPEDDPLSEEELEAIYGGIVPSQTASGLAKFRDGRPPRKPIREGFPAQKPRKRFENNEKASGITREQYQSRPRQHKVERSARRLPIDELVMAASSRIQAEAPWLSKQYEVDTQDPILGSSNPQHKRIVSPSISDDGIPLTTIRKRLKTHKFRPASVLRGKYDARRRKSIARKRFDNEFQEQNVQVERGDGFEACERELGHRPTEKRYCTTPKSLPTKMGLLQLESGPLPEVDFSSCSSGLNLGVENDGLNSACDDGREIRDRSVSSAKTTRRVSFSDRVFSNEVRAQLSSISAPRRVLSLSSDSEEDDEDNNWEVTQEDGEADGEADTDLEEADGLLNCDNERAVVSSPPRRQMIHRPMSSRVSPHKTPGPAPIQSSTKTGVTLDFHSAKRIQHIEVEESIEEGSELETLEATSVAYPPKCHMPRNKTALRGPTSILKRSASSQRETSTSSKDTAANTRKNSTVEVEDSRYLTIAISPLRDPSLARSRVIASRSNKSRYFDESEI